MRWGLWGWIVVGVLLGAGSASATSYSVRTRWQPSSDPGVTGYRIYMRRAGGAFALALDVGMPALALDGTMTTAVPGLGLCASYGLVVTAYRADGTESLLSNEIGLSYASAAPMIDSDHDGLSNAAEDKNLNCVVDPGETDPTKPDTDGDGVLDGSDACQGTLPGAAVNSSGCSCGQIVCDDHNACNGIETCQAGVCHAGTPLACDDGDPCTLDACSPTSGCTHTAIAGCSACASNATCGDGNPCTSDRCIGGRCQHAPLLDGTSCSDGLYCNGAETCRSGVCVGVPVACDDGNVCTADRCDEAQRACVHTAIAACCTQDSDCADTNACTTNERCVSSLCVRDPVQCVASGPCMAASCDPATGCQTTALPDGTPCDDGNACTLNTTCTAGVCSSTTAVAPDVFTDADRTRLSTSDRSDGLLVRAHAFFALPFDLDLTAGAVTVELADESGAVGYAATVPIERFKTTAGRLSYRDEAGGAIRIELARRARRWRLSVHVTLRSAERRIADLVRGSSTKLDWAVTTSSRCVTGSGRCKGRGYRCY